MRSSTTALAALLAAIALISCTSVQVKPIGADNRIAHVCIQDNPLVKVDDFVPTMREGFENHNITTEVVSGSLPDRCEYAATYTARQSWDFVTYLSEARIEMRRSGRLIASADYHLRAKGGLAPNKWEGTRTKMLPVMDQLLAQVGQPPGSSEATDSPAPSPSHSVVPGEGASNDLSARLKALKDAYEQGLIAKDEYDARRKVLADQF